jgi:hypothetical protein
MWCTDRAPHGVPSASLLLGHHERFFTNAMKSDSMACRRAIIGAGSLVYSRESVLCRDESGALPLFGLSPLPHAPPGTAISPVRAGSEWRRVSSCVLNALHWIICTAACLYHRVSYPAPECSSRPSHAEPSFDPSPVFIYNLHSQQGCSPNAAQCAYALSTWLRHYG